MAGNTSAPNYRWFQERLQQPGPWVDTLVIFDLNYWDDPISCAGRKRPRIRQLAAVWGWSKTKAGLAVKEWDIHGTIPGHPRDKRGTTDGASTPTNLDGRDKPRTEPGQTQDKPRTAPKYTRARSSPSPPPPPSQTSVFQRLAKYWKDSHPEGADLDHRSGIGKGLYRQAKKHGEARVLTVLKWADTSMHQRAVFLRKRGSSLATLMEPSNFETYLAFAEAPEPVSYDAAAEEAWTCLRTVLFPRGALPPVEKLHPEPQRAYALKATLEEVGPYSELCRMNDFQLRGKKPEFLTSFGKHMTAQEAR